MTTYKCKKCGEWFNQGITRDIKYNKCCADCLIKVLKELRNDLSLWKSGGKGGQDNYAGLPSGFRIIDEVIEEE